MNTPQPDRAFVLFEVNQTRAQQKIPKFTLQYVFQEALYTIWRERNARRHGGKPFSANRLIHLLDKNIRNKFTTIQRMGDDKYEEGLRFWFATRSII